ELGLSALRRITRERAAGVWPRRRALALDELFASSLRARADDRARHRERDDVRERDPIVVRVRMTQEFEVRTRPAPHEPAKYGDDKHDRHREAGANDRVAPARHAGARHGLEKSHGGQEQRDADDGEPGCEEDRREDDGFVKTVHLRVAEMSAEKLRG